MTGFELRDLTLGAYLDSLADRVPAPGGGASAALHAAQASALLSMVARYSQDRRFAEHASVIAKILDSAEDLRREALDLADLDARAFAVVAAAFALPHNDERETAERAAAVAASSLAAAFPPGEVIRCAGDVMALAEMLLPVSNRNLLTDVAAAADAARAAATTGRVNVEVNLRSVTDRAADKDLRKLTDSVDDIVDRADRLSATVRELIAI